MLLEPDQKSTRAPKGAAAGSRLPAISLLFALASCYGTLALVAVIGAFGISVRINSALWGATITALTALTWVALACRARRHRLGPMLLGLAGLCAIVWAMLIRYALGLEVTGFAGLAGAVMWDRRCCSSRRKLG